MADKDENNVDLTQEHKKPTEKDLTDKKETSNAGAHDENAEPTATIEPEPAGEKPKDPEEDQFFLPSKEIAQMAVVAIESFICLQVPTWIREEEFTPGELQRLDLLAIAAIPKADMTDMDIQLMQRNASFTKRMGEQMPLDDKTRKQYTKAWERVIDKWNVNLTPEKALIASTVMIVGSRAFPVVMSKGAKAVKKFKSFLGW